MDWINPNYDDIYKDRASRLERLRGSPEILPGLMEHYKDKPVQFIEDWGMTFDPRNVEIGLPAIVPFVLFERQREFIQWLYDHWKGREDGLAEKSRDMGASWLCVSFAVWMWLFHPGTVCGFGSRKEEYVDKLGDPKSLFWKARKFIDLLPQEFTPIGYVEKRDAPYMRIVNPDNDSAIVGEAGDNIGRGNRTSIYFKDESAFYDRAEAIDAALSQTSNCKIDISTPNGNGNAFYRKRHSGKIDVFTFHWTQDPRKSEEWYKKQKDTLDAVIVAQEIDIDYNASTTDAWFNGDVISVAQRKGPADIEAVGGWMVGIDAAHFGDDESIIHYRRGRLNLEQVARKKVDGIQLAAILIDDMDSKGIVPFAIVIELDGPGVSCYDQLKKSKYASKVVGLHTGTRLSDNKNYNIRARLHRKAKEYLGEGSISLPNDPELKSQMASIKYKYKDGLLIMQSKKEYKSLYGRSPDKMDAFLLTFGAEEVEDDEEYEEYEMASGWMA